MVRELSQSEKVLISLHKAQSIVFVKPASINETDVAIAFVAGTLTPDETLERLRRVGYSLDDIETWVNSLLK